MRWIGVIIMVLPAIAGELERARLDAGRLYLEWKLEEAERVLREAVQKERRAGATDPLFPVALNELGTLNQDLGNYREAERLYRESIARGDPPPAGWSLGFPMTNLSGLMISYGRPKDALDLANRGGPNYAKSFGPESVHIGRAHNNAAVALTQLGRFDEAEAAAGKAMAILQKYPIGENLGVSYYILAQVASLRGEPIKAEGLLKTANAIWGETLPPGHPTAITGLAGLGALKAQSAPQESAQLLQKALELSEAKFGKHHYFTGTIMMLYADTLELGGRKREAKAVKKRGEEVLNAFERANLLHHTIDMNAFRVKTLK
jgi:tetratricopeptide (TPR) repeat protein